MGRLPYFSKNLFRISPQFALRQLHFHDDSGGALAAQQVGMMALVIEKQTHRDK